MLQKFLQKIGLEQLPEATNEEKTAQYAAAVLLIEMTEADMEVEPSERDAVREALRSTFQLDSDTIEELVRAAQTRKNDDVSYYPHVETINELCSGEEKIEIVRHMWKVAYADGQLDKYEEHYLRQLCRLIHVSHQHFIRTKLEVQESMS